MEFNTKEVREYFLGDCTGQRAEILERRFLENPDLQEVVLATESELIDEFIDGELSASDHERFISNYLITTVRSRKVSDAKALRSFSKAKNRTPFVATRAVENDPFFIKIFAWFRANGLVTAGGLAVIVLIATVAVFVYDRNGNDLSAKYVAINKQDLSDMSRFNATSKLLLVSGSQRGSNNTSKIKAGASTEVFIKLALPRDIIDSDTFQLSVERSTVKIYSQKNLRSYAISNGMELRVVLPTILFERGEYQIVVSPASKPNDSIKYSFNVE